MNILSGRGWRSSLLALIVFTTLTGCVGVPGKSMAVPELRPGVLAGYLPTKALPNSLALLPAPPAKGSAAYALDEDIAQKSFSLRNTSRWRLAISDADLDFPHAAGTFSCALNAPISEQDTPHLYVLLRRSLTDVLQSTHLAKDKYNRSHPFMLNQQPICTPDEKARLEHDGSYPSGHAATGWAWALMLGEISPRQIDAILARGRAFGESRNVCNVHWHSDVMQGHFMGAGTVARLHADATFRADLEAAREDLEAVRRKGLKPSRDCDAEASAMALQLIQ